MPNRPPLRARLVAALAKRTLLASSSASLRSSAVRSGARLNINGLVYHRRKALGLPSLPGAGTLLSAVPPGLVAVATRLHGAPPARAALGDRRCYCGIGLRLPPRRPPLGALVSQGLRCAGPGASGRLHEPLKPPSTRDLTACDRRTNAA